MRPPRWSRHVHRRLASTALDNKAYTKTLLLPKTTFPLWPESDAEEKWRKRSGEELYRWQWENARGPLFVLHDGPPYANGEIHMGHALNKIMKDIINRYHVLLGHRVQYIPGWDCHGLPIENKALKELGGTAKSLPPSTIRAAALATALREVESQREVFRRLGVMADWSEGGTYRTLDHAYEMRQLRVFQKMVENGLIYSAHRPVSYSPSSRSALAEAELEYFDNHVSTSVYLAFQLDAAQIPPGTPLGAFVRTGRRVEVLVWTTTPWTLSANMGIAVHPEMIYAVLRALDDDEGILIVARERVHALSEVIGHFKDLGNIQGSDLVDLPYLSLFPNLANPTKLKIIPSTHVTPTSGTGLVHCAPAHGAEDYLAFRSLSSTSSLVCHVDLEGRFTEQITGVLGDKRGRRLVGLEVLYKGGKEMVELLRELRGQEGGGRLVREEKVKHRYPYDWKTGKPVIVLATEQWFANLEGIKDDALKVLEDVQFYPAASRKRLTSHVLGRSEWCISRQRVWGVPIPSLHHVSSGRVVLNSSSMEHILGVLEKTGTQWWWDGPVEDFVPPPLKAEGKWRKGTDTMDVWFDSGTSWSMLRSGSEGIEDGRKYDADVCLEGSDQHRGWFQSLLLTAVGSSPEIGTGRQKDIRSPYRALITHGMVLDEKGRKMSKSDGNIISPMTIINGGPDRKKQPPYAADVLRLWVATVEYGTDMNIGPSIIASCMEMVRRVRNSARFILGNLGSGGEEHWERVPKNDLGLAERFVMHELWTLENIAKEGYASYNFPKVVHALTNFASLTLSSLYFDITKDCLYANTNRSQARRAVLTVLEQVLKTMVSVMAPVLPHLVEEIHSHFVSGREQPPDLSVFANKWDFLDPHWCDPRAQEDMTELLRVRAAVLSVLEKARGNKQLGSSLEADVDLIVPGDMTESAPLWDLLQREEQFLKTWFIVSDVTLLDEGSLGTSSPEWVHMGSVDISDSQNSIGIRVRPAMLNKCPRCWTFTRMESHALCRRCAQILYVLQFDSPASASVAYAWVGHDADG